ncbi:MULTISPECIES: alpha/beta hydrolase fold domain-containing protein [unclassified Rhodococcus (in: high G+C Gram-positive bacteria)]|uniref:alpha/beta hydrolase fold domain-containing protein n=1 Tax=unclassified Rhodococcus (in: high G+C Gram-positive bacteria) TaxID=192944 RepID=UPI000AB049B5|nr:MULTISPECIES: alpha/beta hydrolase fold domain-containing protein [unclassified Rhodococcus (in: high G+C Gram-positive bacteria)]
MTHDTGDAHSGRLPRPEIDAELRAGLAIVGGVFPPTITPDLVPFMRRSYASPPLADILEGHEVDHREFTVAGHLGDPLTVSVFSSPNHTGPRPVVLYAHSGGLMFGDRFNALALNLEWVERLGAILVSPEYRLAPEFPDPYAREDMYSTLLWIIESAELLNIDTRRVMVAGASAGGGLAAGLALASRDRGGPALCGQLLVYPMLDDRGLTVSTDQFDAVGVWDRISNETGWRAVLGDRYRTDDVSPYIAPARATDLARLPPAYLDVGSAEIFRDEAVAYATSLWHAGGDAELHVWNGGFHAFDIFAPHTTLAQGMIRTRTAWVENRLAD